MDCRAADSLCQLWVWLCFHKQPCDIAHSHGLPARQNICDLSTVCCYHDLDGDNKPEVVIAQRSGKLGLFKNVTP
jgi:hypothetical protein